MQDLDTESLRPSGDRRRKHNRKVIFRVTAPHGCRIVRVRSKPGNVKTGNSFLRRRLRWSWNCLRIHAIFWMVFFLCVWQFRSLILESQLASPHECSVHYVSSTNLWSRSDTCTPVTDIFFLKTHKCASSSVQNILMRFGDKKNLSFVLPVDANYIGHPEKFSRSMIFSQKKPAGGFNILCHHLRFNAKEVHSVLRPSAVFLTILREPVGLFRSMYDYYEMSNYTKQTLDQFMRNETSMKQMSTERFSGKIGSNQMMFDLGYDNKELDNDTKISEAIKEVDESFDLVMIAELFDESLILLKNMLCWSMEDILYLKHNRRTVDSDKPMYYNETSERIRAYNRADQELYDYFVKKLEDDIEKFGRQRMAQEVEDLRTWNRVWTDHCIGRISATDSNVPLDNRAYSSKVFSFVLKDEPIASICKDLAMVEIPYTQKLIEKQKSMF